MDVKSRHHLRSDAADDIRESLAATLGVAVDADSFEAVELVEADWEVVLVDGEPLVLYLDGEPFVTVQGANALSPERRVVTVDAGAIEFVSNGADIMRPGVVEADPGIDQGELVVVAEETHGKFLAVGRALTDGADMVGDQGRVVESIHHVGDDLFDLSV